VPKWYRDIGIAFVASLVALGALYAGTVMAIGQPVSVSIDDVDGYTGILEAGDLLIVAEYDINYGTAIPTDFDANAAFIFSLETSTGSVEAVNAPYAYNESGYNKGVVSLYISSASRDAAGFTWPFSDDGMVVRLKGNPTVFTTIPAASPLTLTGTHFQSTDDATTNKNALTTRVVQAAGTLEQAWALLLLNSSNLLNDTGADYFTRAIPGLRSMAPAAFAISTESPNFGTPVPTPGGYASTVTGRYATSTIFGTATTTQTTFGSLENDTGVPAQVWKGLLFLVAVVAFVGFAAVRLGGGAATGAIGFSAIVGLPVAVDQGFVAWAFGALIIAMLVTFGLVKGIREAVG
jgi:hypothetical protein